MILTVDPGFSARNATGVSLFNPIIQRLVATSLIRRDPKLEGLDAMRHLAWQVRAWAFSACPSKLGITVLVAETPFVYPDERDVNPNTALMPLMGIVGCIAGSLLEMPEVVTYPPRAWKGSIDGDTFGRRILTRLDPRELALVNAVLPASLRHNAIDSVGLGLKFLGRLERQRVAHVEP